MKPTIYVKRLSVGQGFQYYGSMKKGYDMTLPSKYIGRDGVLTANEIEWYKTSTVAEEMIKSYGYPVEVLHQ